MKQGHDIDVRCEFWLLASATFDAILTETGKWKWICVTSFSFSQGDGCISRKFRLSLVIKLMFTGALCIAELKQVTPHQLVLI